MCIPHGAARSRARPACRSAFNVAPCDGLFLGVSLCTFYACSEPQQTLVQSPVAAMHATVVIKRGPPAVVYNSRRLEDGRLDSRSRFTVSLRVPATIFQHLDAAATATQGPAPPTKRPAPSRSVDVIPHALAIEMLYL